MNAEAVSSVSPVAGGENTPGFARAAGGERAAEAESGVAAGGDPDPFPEAGPEIEVVVARYREDTAWTKALGLPCLVYDKSGQPGPLALPNVGRETQTYLTHIVRRYETLAQYTVFVQADPFDHMGPGADVVSLRERIVQNARLGVKFTGFAWYKLKCDRLGRPHALADPQKAGAWPGYARDIPVGEVYATLFRGPVPETFLTQAPAGLLFVARQRVLTRPKAFYRKALELVEADPDDAGNTGHAFERLWPVIFGGNQALNRDHY
ncbi:hypothetical protein JCM15519_05020 [Fundidesulfovibrio butyratiphilus]